MFHSRLSLVAKELVQQPSKHSLFDSHAITGHQADSNAVPVTVLQVEEVRVNKAMARSMKKRVEVLMDFLTVSAHQLLSIWGVTVTWLRPCLNTP
jgi:hypothetical protein